MGNRAAQDRKRVADRIKMAGFNDPRSWLGI